MPRYDRLGCLPLEKILPFLGNNALQALGETVRGNSLRLMTFACKGITCTECGVEGKFFAVERTGHKGGYHINLYAVDRYGHERLMTHDHIVPRSRDGLDKLCNSQTMCEKCNSRKGNRIHFRNA